MLRAALLALFLPLMIGCGGGVIFERDPQTGKFIETHRFKSEDDLIYYSIDSSLRDELAGRHPQGGDATWQVHWKKMILVWRSYGNSRYEAYLVHRREELHMAKIKVRRSEKT